MQWGARRDFLAAMRVEFLLGLALTVMCVGVMSSRPVQLAGLRPARNVLIGIGLLFFIMLTQIPFAAAKDLAWTIFFDRVIKFAMMTFFMVALIRSPRAMRWFLAAFLVSCFYITQESTRGQISGGLVWENQGIMRLHGAVPIYAHPNSLAGLAMGTLPFVIFLFPVIRSWKYKLMLLPLAATAIVCVIFTGSRTGYVALGVLLLYWWTQSQRKVRNLMIATVVGVAVFPLLPDQYVERFKSIGGQEAEGNSKETRIVILKDAWEVLLRNPIGVGIASFPAVRLQMFNRKQDTHNLYLEVATNLGVHGFAVFCFLIYSVLAALDVARTAYKREQVKLKKLLGSTHESRQLSRLVSDEIYELRFLEATTQATTGFLIVRLTLGLFGMDLYEVYWWFAAGMSFCLLQIWLVLRRRLESLANVVSA
jgi:O-antigen ligase